MKKITYDYVIPQGVMYDAAEDGLKTEATEVLVEDTDLDEWLAGVDHESILNVRVENAEVGDEIKHWETRNLSNTGRYVGDPLREFGFPFDRGDYVPVDERYSAMRAHRYALNCRGKYNSGAQDERRKER